MLGNLLTVLLFVGAASGLRWSDRLRSDVQSIEVCSGQNIQLFWNFTLEKGERVKGMEWACQTEEKEDALLAVYMDDHFVPMSTFSGRLSHLQDGGIELSCATILETGSYSIAVSIEDSSDSLTVHRKTASVKVVDMPRTMTGEIHVIRKAEATRDVTTGAWHVQLSCGNFSDRGNPPVDVIWMTPSGDQLDSTSYQDGFFHLLLPNPLVGGNYTCTIPPWMPAAKCLAGDSPLLHTASVEVEENAGRFTLLEAQQQEILDKLATERESWMGFHEDVTNRTDVLEQRLDEALRNTGQLFESVHFHARLTSDTVQSIGSIVKLTTVISNQGDGYDPNTGYFTAPVNGIYFFIGTAGPNKSNNVVGIYLKKENSIVAQTDVRQIDPSRSMGSCHATLDLKAGQKMWLESEYGNSYFKSKVTSFSGFRI